MFVILSVIVLEKEYTKMHNFVASLKLLLVDPSAVRYSNTYVGIDLLPALLISTCKSNRGCCFARVFLKVLLFSEKAEIGK